MNARIPDGLFGHDSLPAQRQLASCEPPTEAQVEQEIREERICSDVYAFGEFISLEATDVREVLPCKYFGPITSERLVSEILLNRYASDKQIAEAARELRRRYLESV